MNEVVKQVSVFFVVGFDSSSLMLVVVNVVVGIFDFGIGGLLVL